MRNGPPGRSPLSERARFAATNAAPTVRGRSPLAVRGLGCHPRRGRLRLSDNLTGYFAEGIDRRGLQPTGPNQRQLEFWRCWIQATAHDALLLVFLN